LDFEVAGELELGGSLLVIGYWSVVIGDWSLVNEDRPP
jgi:hypothetical protein